MSVEIPEVHTPFTQQGEDGNQYMTLAWYEFFSRLADEFNTVQDTVETNHP